jgi:uncharacterized protein (DUF433 family)
MRSPIRLALSCAYMNMIKRIPGPPGEEGHVKASDLISVDPAIMSGTPCFRGTRVPVAVLFDNLADGLSIDEILESWPSLNREDVVAVLVLASDQVIKAAA